MLDPPGGNIPTLYKQQPPHAPLNQSYYINRYMIFKLYFLLQQRHGGGQGEAGLLTVEHSCPDAQDLVP